MEIKSNQLIILMNALHIVEIVLIVEVIVQILVGMIVGIVEMIVVIVGIVEMIVVGICRREIINISKWLELPSQMIPGATVVQPVSK